MEDPPPDAADNWQELAKIENVVDKTIHGIHLASASRFKREHYLALRILWKVWPVSSFRPGKFGLRESVEKASRQLDMDQSWKSYCAMFQGGPLEGAFALPRFYQKQVDFRTPEDAYSRFDVTAGPPTPISRRTRSRLVRDINKLSLETPSKKPNTPQTPILGLDSDEDETPPEQRSYGPPELLEMNFPRTKDEQSVNTALIDFLNAFIVHRGLSVQWTLYRKPFSAEFAKSSFQARTDGCLENPDFEKPYALVEVKPLLRRRARFTIAMQEAAQMVGWMKTEPDPKGLKYSCGRRLHVSQDRHEIFIIFAEYSENYVRYLNNTLDPGEDLEFMTMHEFGPWDTRRLSDMKIVGKILLAIALRAEDESKAWGS